MRRFAPLIALLLPAAPATAQSVAFTDVTVIDVVEGAAVVFIGHDDCADRLCRP